MLNKLKTYSFIILIIQGHNLEILIHQSTILIPNSTVSSSLLLNKQKNILTAPRSTTSRPKSVWDKKVSTKHKFKRERERKRTDYNCNIPCSHCVPSSVWGTIFMHYKNKQGRQLQLLNHEKNTTFSLEVSKAHGSFCGRVWIKLKTLDQSPCKPWRNSMQL